MRIFLSFILVRGMTIFLVYVCCFFVFFITTLRIYNVKETTTNILFVYQVTKLTEISINILMLLIVRNCYIAVRKLMVQSNIMLIV
jgi:hypothetical protein